MALTVHLDIVSIEQKIFSGLAEMVIVTGALGELGVMPGHAALLTAINPGPVRVIKQGGIEEVFYVSGGILEVQPDVVSVLADTALRAADLDEARAAEAREQAERLVKQRKSDADISRAFIELAQAIAQLRTIRMYRRSK